VSHVLITLTFQKHPEVELLLKSTWKSSNHAIFLHFDAFIGANHRRRRHGFVVGPEWDQVRDDMIGLDMLNL
jgi:hypothetical protein